MGPNPISWQTYICTMSMSMTCWRNFYNGSVAMCNRHILFHNFTEEELVESLVLFYLPKLNPCHSTYTYSCLWLAGMDVWLWLCDLLTLDLDLEGCRWKRQTLPLSSQNHFVQEVTLSGFFLSPGQYLLVVVSVVICFPIPTLLHEIFRSLHALLLNAYIV